MDITALRLSLLSFVGDLKDHCTNASIPRSCVDLGLPVPADIGSKRTRWYAAFNALDDEDVPRFAQVLLKRGMLGPQLRNEVQDILWSDLPTVEVPKRQRREIARTLQPFGLFRHWEHFARLIKTVFVLYDTPAWLATPDRRRGDLEEIRQRFVQNPEDSNVEWLFEHLKVFDLSNRRFSVFLEGLASADVQVDTANQVSIINAMNVPLATCGAVMRPMVEFEGYPVYSLVALRSARGRAKNLIFASARKPDIRFRDAVNNDIEIVTNAKECLVYDRPLGVEGLRWRELQQWWSETTNQHDPELAKTTLYRRLLSCLPDSSPPQRLLFKSFYSSFGPLTADLPALLPEVWLHWDPLTVVQRGAQALLNHRMDFLLLLPGGSRVIIEVDGVQHYADEAGRADTRRYAQLAAGDRKLKLSGYEIYRFAGIELKGSDATSMVTEFFRQLFVRHGIQVNR